MKMTNVLRTASAVSLALALSTSYAAGTDTKDSMTGKQKATAIGATSGAVAGAVVAGPVGAVVGAGVGAVVGYKGTDANGKVDTNNGNVTRESDATVRSAQEALKAQGYNVGAVDGRWGPATRSAVRSFQGERNITQTGTLDDQTLTALNVVR